MITYQRLKQFFAAVSLCGCGLGHAGPTGPQELDAGAAQSKATEQAAEMAAETREILKLLRKDAGPRKDGGPPKLKEKRKGGGLDVGSVRVKTGGPG